MAIRENDFSVMTLNLRFGLAGDGENAWLNRKSMFVRIFKQYPADFMGVQEANHFQTQFLSEQLNDHDFIGWHNRSKERWQSNPIFFDRSWTCLEHKHYFLSDTPDTESRLPGSKWPRQCVIGLFGRGDTRIVMANTHFDFDESVQEKSAQLVTGFLAGFPSDCPVIITGDFNASPGGKAYAVFKSHGFSEVFDHHHATTYHKFRGEETLDHIDWILHRGPVKVVQQQLITDSFSGRYPSDHYPVLAAFSFIFRPGRCGPFPIDHF